MYEFKGIKLHWLGHDGFLIETSKKIYIDPFKIRTAEKADIILLTHSHYDHCSISDISKIATNNTIIVCPADCLSKLNQFNVQEIKPVEPGQSIKVEGFLIETIAAYNPAKPFHPRINNWVGYIVTIDGIRIYHAGDSDLTEEMSLVKCDIALLPVSGTFVMTAEEAAEASGRIKPKIAIPMHYGEIIGSSADAKLFKEKAACEVVILEKE